MRPSDRTTTPVRVYRGDHALLTRTAREQTVIRKRTVTVTELIHEQLAQLRLDERAREQEQKRGDAHGN